jgi:hypothetical protein
MQFEIPVPGPALPFDEWTRVLVTRLRELLPDVTAARRSREVTIGRPNAARVVTITERRGAYWIETVDAGAPMAMLVDSDRHDVHTARTFARSIAGGYDARLARPD